MSQTSFAPTGSASGPSTGDILQGASSAIDGIFGLIGALDQSRSLKADARQRELEGIAIANDRARAGRAAVAAGAAVGAASGFTLEGSATDVLARLAAEAETSSGRARFEARRDAAKLRFEAKQRKRAGIFGLFKGLLSSASSAAAAGGGG